MTDKELAVKYAPHLYFDKNEPFPVIHIGYSIICQSGRSPSFNRDIRFDPEKVAFAIEYQIYYDYDIQHMYDLEHFWVYVGHDGNVYDAEASQHGSYLNCYRLNKAVEEDTHVPAYVQPGKHAMLPEGNLFKLFGNYQAVCNQLAGLDGLLITDLFKGRMHSNAYIDYHVCSHIRDRFSFEPSLDFHPVRYDEEIYVPWEELFQLIPQRIEKMVRELGLFGALTGII